MTLQFLFIILIVILQLKTALTSKIGFEFEVYSSQGPQNIFPASIATLGAHQYVRVFFLPNQTLGAQLYSMDGNYQSNISIISSLPNLINPQLLVFQKNNGMIVTFIQNVPPNMNYYGQILDSNLTLVGSLITISSKDGNTPNTNNLFLPIAEIENGLAVAFATPNGPGNNANIFCVILDYQGNVNSKTQINKQNNISPYVSISSVNNGSDIAFTYQSTGPGPGAGAIYASMLEKDGKTLKFQDVQVGTSPNLPVTIGMNYETEMAVIYASNSNGGWNIISITLNGDGKPSKPKNIGNSQDPFPGIMIAVTANKPQDKYILAYLGTTANISTFILDKDLNVIGWRSEVLTNFSITNFQVSAMSSRAGYIISYTSNTESYGQMFSYCPQQLFWENSTCLTTFKYPSNETNSSLYLFYCPSQGVFEEGFCCDKNCMSCNNEICKCEANYTTNFSSDSCIYCGPEVETCHINNSQLIPETCHNFYHLYDSACCPLNSTSCYFANNTIIVTNCSSPYTPINGFCCPPGSQDCYINGTGHITSTQCNSSFVLINNNTCCPPNVITCDLDQEGDIVVTCLENFESIGDLCCPPHSTSCSLNDNATVTAETCAYPYQPINQICCPPGSTNCSIGSNGIVISTQCNSSFILINNETCCPPDVTNCYLNQTKFDLTCVENFNELDGLCCPPHSTSCSLNDNHTVTADTCDLLYQPINQICCPPDATYCDLDSNNNIANVTCNLTYVPIDKLCCPPASTSCTIDLDGLVALICNTTYDNLLNGLCCPPEATSCNIDDLGNIVPAGCHNNYQVIDNLCCPPESGSCKLAQNGTIIVESCNSTKNYTLIGNTCCPPFSTNCTLESNGTIIVNQCESGYYLGLHGLCRECQSNCEECVLDSTTNNNDLCLTCEKSFYLFENTCVNPCPQDFHITNSTWCCPQNCLSCHNGSRNCTLCNDGYFVSEGICVSQCPPHYLPNQGVCKNILAMCNLVCDVSYLCSVGFFQEDCAISQPILDAITSISILLSILKLIFLIRAKQKSVLVKLLLHHAYADIMVCFIIFVILNPTLIGGIHFVSAVVFYGNLLGCAFTLEIFLCGFLQMYGSKFFERNLNKIIIGTYITCLLLGFCDYFIMREIKQSPYLLIGLGGLAILVLDCVMAVKIRNLQMNIDIKYLIVFPSILAITWGLASVPLFGASLSEFFFWFSFVASFLNYSQPIFNTLLYGPVILRANKQISLVPEAEMKLNNSVDSEITHEEEIGYDEL